MAKKQHRKNYHPEYNFWLMCKDIIIAGMNKGQLLPILLWLVLVLILLKLPQKDISKLVFLFIDQTIKLYLLGYILFFVTLVSWKIHSKYQRSIITKEINRISDERTKWQKKALGYDDIESSED